MTEESNTLSEISILIVYVTICILDSGMYSAVNQFLNLIELKSAQQKGSLYLVCGACDGAALITGSGNGATKTN